ncbi:MAG: hypothetical protein ACR2NP_17495 [Pirellulaceae bacterium]
MTVQQPDILICEHPSIDLEGFVTFSDNGWFRANLELPLHVFEAMRKYPSGTNTGLNRGYVATFRINGNGTFELVSVEFPLHEPACVQRCNFVFEGDFFVPVWRYFADSLNIRIPFEDGVVNENRDDWKVVGKPRYGDDWAEVLSQVGIRHRD